MRMCRSRDGYDLFWPSATASSSLLGTDEAPCDGPLRAHAAASVAATATASKRGGARVISQRLLEFEEVMTDPSHRILNSLSASTQQWAARREALGPELWDDELREALRDGVHSAENLAAAEGVQLSVTWRHWLLDRPPPWERDCDCCFKVCPPGRNCLMQADSLVLACRGESVSMIFDRQWTERPATVCCAGGSLTLLSVLWLRAQIRKAFIGRQRSSRKQR